jgi:tRNA modification GTPase
MSGRDTIAAIATPPGAGGIGVVRVSGDHAAGIARTLLGRLPRARHAHFATLSDADGPIDHGLLLYFPGPASYTGEDVLELQLHGSMPVLHRLLRWLDALGARAARPGEFTERAFLNGKLDLAQAEAVADLIAAGSDAAARAAQRSLDGEFSRRVHALTDAVIRTRIWIEAAIDFPEEEIDFLSTPSLHADLAALLRDSEALLAATRCGQRLRDGLHVVILGRPNAGKSSLLNALAQSDRAIVSDIAGTTRDLLRETVDIDGIALTLVDTAGLRDAGDAIEREGMRRARAELARADLALLVTDDASAIEDAALLDAAPAGAARIIVHNKIDLDGAAAHRETRGNDTHLWLSATTGAGLDALRAALRDAAGIESSNEGTFTARARHVDALERAHAHLQHATSAITARGSGEIAAEELRLVQRELAGITGVFSSDDLLGRIFADFCIGK